MQRNSRSIARCAALIFILAPSGVPAPAQQPEEVPTLTTGDVRPSGSPPPGEPAAGSDVASFCPEARNRRDAYLEIWKSQFLKRNTMDRAYLDAHIQVRSAEVECEWVSGLSLRVQYTVQIDWATIEAQDQIIVMLYESESAYRHLPIRRDHFFDEAEVAFAIDKSLFFAGISTVKPASKLAFRSQAAAIEAFRKKAGVRALDDVRIAFYVPGNVPRIDGHPYMLARGTLDAAKNLCVEGHVNLVTGEITSWEDACIVH